MIDPENYLVEAFVTPRFLSPESIVFVLDFTVTANPVNCPIMT